MIIDTHVWKTWETMAIRFFLQWILYALLLLVLKYNENGWTEFDSKHIMAECNHNTLYMHLKLTKIKNVH